MDALSNSSKSSITITVPLCERDRAFLRSIRVAGGRLQLVRSIDRESAKACHAAGYARISLDGNIVRLTGHGQAYLDRLMRAH
ncbi:hypothetical protein [Rhizobium rhizoryzae]|uniref:Uncharacterized protein n=1 Tax=Rhizobium rhizoryzae TaxID=451876 RepID=A0A7W6LKJ3_9HYPH|nr:hypothetical protein [Rhizobium rhizoryzae]MBB4146044.1 hypothetical protein [Rhizobium rhizoryzae]